jgi:hypothetical protein
MCSILSLMFGVSLRNPCPALILHLPLRNMVKSLFLPRGRVANRGELCPNTTFQIVRILTYINFAFTFSIRIYLPERPLLYLYTSVNIRTFLPMYVLKLKKNHIIFLLCQFY